MTHTPTPDQDSKPSLRMEYHPSDALWIVEDLTRQGCWSSGTSPEDALINLGFAQNDYDEFFPLDSSAPPADSEQA